MEKFSDMTYGQMLVHGEETFGSCVGPLFLRVPFFVSCYGGPYRFRFRHRVKVGRIRLCADGNHDLFNITVVLLNFFR